MKVISISAKQDELASPAKIEASRSLLPANTNWVSDPGWRPWPVRLAWPQSDDLPASISHEEQQAQTVAAILDLLKSVDQNP